MSPRTPTAAEPPRNDVDARRSERGAVLPMVALTITIMLICAGLAVDVSALQRRGQDLQNTTDAAALAAVQSWSALQDEAAAIAIAEDLIAQNGELDDDLIVDIEFPNEGSVRVELTDPSPDVFLANGVISGDGLTRDSLAAFAQCSSCSSIVPIGQPIPPVEQVGGGDGFIPIVHKTRIYGLNHHSNEIGCVDALTGELCYEPRDVASSSWGSNNTNYHHVWEDKIYFTVSDDIDNRRPNEDSDVMVTCWDTLTESRCSRKYRIRREQRGMLTGVDDKVYLLTGGRKMYCFDLPNITPCSGYGSEGLEHPIEDGGDSNNKSYEHADSLYHDGHIYNTVTLDGDHQFSCWSIIDDRECDGWDLKEFDAHYIRGGRLMLHRDTNGVPNAVCIINPGEIECFDESDGDPVNYGSAFHELLDDQEDAHPDSNNGGTHAQPHYHEPSNKLFFTAGHPNSEIFCWDFTTASYCDSHDPSTDFGEPETYGVATWGDCLVGLGDTSIFFTISTDYLECSTGIGDAEFVPCICASGAEWPTFSGVNLEGLVSFKVQVRRNFDNQVVFPPDAGDDFFELIDSGSVDLNEHLDPPTPGQQTTVYVIAESSDGSAPWEDDLPPILVIASSATGPVLVE